MPPPPAGRFVPVIGGRHIMLCCHSATLSGHHSPNSLAAVIECLEAGAVRIEIDIQFLADATPIVFHDHDVSAETTGSGAIRTLGPATARGLHYRSGGEPVAFLADVVAAVAGTTTCLQVDLKPSRMLEAGEVRALAAALDPIAEQVLLGSQAHWNLRPFAGRGIRLAFDPSLHLRVPPEHGDTERLPRTLGRHGLLDDAPLAAQAGVAFSAYVRSRVEDIRGLLPAAVEWMVDIATVRLLARGGVPLGTLLAEDGIELAAWTVRRDEGPVTDRLLGELAAAGAATVITDAAAVIADRFGA